MRALDYAIREAWASLRQRRGASAFAVLAIALAMTVLGALLLITWNAERLVSQWASVAEVSVFLLDDATSGQRGELEAVIDQSGAALDREYVSKEQALGRFRREFAELASLTAGLDSNPFPASVEVRMRPEAERDGRATALVRQVAALPGVADVRYDREWLGRVTSGLQTTRRAGLVFALLMALAAGVTVAAVVRIGLFARTEEIQIMRLVGSPMAFIRGPFVAEGLLQGGGGAIVAMLLLWAGFSVMRAWWDTELGALLDDSAVAFLPIRLCAFVVAGGMLVGGAGGLVASWRAE